MENCGCKVKKKKRQGLSFLRVYGWYRGLSRVEKELVLVGMALKLLTDLDKISHEIAMSTVGGKVYMAVTKTRKGKDEGKNGKR